MKKISITSILVLVLFPLSLFAQEIELPGVEIRVSQDKVPYRVKEALLNDYGTNHAPFAWVTPQSIFSTSLWEATENPSILEVHSYAIHTRTTNGDQLDALYSADGQKISSREYFKDFKPPMNILYTLQNSGFKDWRIKRDVHLIKRFSNGKEKERYEFVMMNKEKGKKFVYFDKDGMMIAQKNFALAEAEW